MIPVFLYGWAVEKMKHDLKIPHRYFLKGVNLVSCPRIDIHNYKNALHFGDVFTRFPQTPLLLRKTQSLIHLTSTEEAFSME